MKKLVPFCLVSLAMTVSACGDDEGAIVPVETPDGSAESTVETHDSGADESTVEEETTDSGATSVAPTTDDAGGESSTSVVADSGMDGSTEPAPEVDGGDVDSGVTSGATVDGGWVDGGATSETDAGPTELTACESACAAAAAKGCADNSTCEADLCEAMYDANPNCIEEANAYLACVGQMSDDADFQCTDDKPQYIGDDCDDPFIIAWGACLSQ